VVSRYLPTTSPSAIEMDILAALAEGSEEKGEL